MNWRDNEQNRPLSQRPTYFFDEVISITALILTTITWESIVVELEGKLRAVEAESAVGETLCAELLRQLVQYLDILNNFCFREGWIHVDVAQRFSFNDGLRMRVCKLGGGSGNN